MRNKIASIDIKVLFHLSWITLVYVVFLTIQHRITDSEWVILGVIRELITIPLMLAQIVIFFSAIIHTIKYGFRQSPYLIWIILIPLINILIPILSIFLSGPVSEKMT